MDYKLEDLVSIASLQSLQEKLYLISPFPTGIIDNDGNILTAVEWQEICTEFFRKHPVCEKECIKSDKFILDHIQDANPSVSYQCPHGLVDTATPIIVEGHHLANFFIGQFFMHKPDMEFYRNYARIYGFEEVAFLEAVKKVPIWSEQQMKNRLDFVKEFIDIITTAGLNRLKELETNKILRESEERFKSIVESTDDFVWTVDPYDYTIKTFNQALYNYLINDRGVVLKIGDTLQMYTGDKADNWTYYYKKALELGKFEIEYEVLSGSKILDLSLNTIKNGNEILAISVFGKDITRLKQNEKELIKAKETVESDERQLRELQAMAEMGSWEFDFMEHIFTFNDNFFKIFQTSIEEMGSNQMTAEEYVARFIHPDDRHVVEEEVKKSIAAKDPDYSGYVEHKIIRKDGSIGYVAVRFYIIMNKSGRVVKSYGVNQDITNKKLNEQELIKAKEKAEESNRLKTAFLMNVYHEIRTPMNGILGFMNLFQEPGLTEEDRIEYVKSVNKSGDRLLNTLNDLIEISKIEIGDIQLRYEKVDLTEVLNFCEDFFTREVDGKDLTLEIAESIKGNHAIIKTDRYKLERILSNILNNAIKFTRKGKVIISNKIQNDRLVFAITDTGVGIPRDKFDVIFERFFQIHMGSKKEHDGSGIGLSIVKAYIEALNGTIEIQSEIGTVTAFSFTLPYTPAHNHTGSLQSTQYGESNFTGTNG